MVVAVELWKKCIQCKKCDGVLKVKSIRHILFDIRIEVEQFVPIDPIEIVSQIRGVELPKECVSFIRKACPCELDEDINGEPEMSTSFSNLRKIKF